MTPKAHSDLQFEKKIYIYKTSEHAIDSSVRLDCIGGLIDGDKWITKITKKMTRKTMKIVETNMHRRTMHQKRTSYCIFFYACS